MSDEREPDYIILTRLPKPIGTKTFKNCKLELFRAEKFKTAWSPSGKDRFIPAVPLRFDDAAKFWESEIYRVRLDGKWHGEKKYTFLDWNGIGQLIKGEAQWQDQE